MAVPARKRPPVPVLRPLLPFGDSPPDTRSTTPPPPPPPPSPLPPFLRRSLTPEEDVLARQLWESYAFRGAAAFVAEYGFDAIAAALDGLQLEGVRNPAAFIRWVVREEARGAG